VVLLRARFLEEAVCRVRDLAERGEIVDARIAAGELGQYFEWVRESLGPLKRQVLDEQIQALRFACGASESGPV